MYAHFMQHSIADCGIASIKTIMKQLKIQVPKDNELYRYYSVRNSEGLSLEEIKRILKRYGVDSIAYEIVNFEKMISLNNFPILLVTEMNGMNHYIVLHEITKENMYIVSDPSKGEIEYYTEKKIKKIFSGYILYISRALVKDKKKKLEKIFFLIQNKKNDNLSDTIYKLCLSELTVVYKLKIALSIMLKHFIPLICLFLLQSMVSESILSTKDQVLFLTMTIILLSVCFKIFAKYEAQKKVIIENNIQEKILLKYYRDKIEDNHSAKKIENISGYFWNLFTSVSGLLDKFYLKLNAFYVLVLMFFTSVVSPVLFLVLLFWLLLYLVYMYIKIDQIKKTEREIVNKSTSFSYAVESNLRSSLDINLFSKNEAAEKFVKKSIVSYFESKRKTVANDLKIYTTYQILSFFALLSVALLYILKVFPDSIVTNDLARDSNGILIMSALINSISPIIQYWLSYQKSSVAIDYIQSGADYSNEENETYVKKINLDEIDKLEMTSINFSYKNSNKLIFKQDSFTFEKGKIYSIIGPNGCGKSTLVKLLTGKLSPGSGIITINDKLKTDSLENTDINQYLALYTPEFYIYGSSVAKNIYFNVFDTSNDFSKEEKYEDILGLELPDNYNLSENGTNLSQGQRQKILLMRALYTDKSIYVFDEPTSNLDQDAKKNFLNRIVDLAFQNKIVIIVTHEESVQKISDFVIDLDDYGGTYE